MRRILWGVCIFAVIAAFIRHSRRGIFVFRADSEGAKGIDQLQRRVREGVSKLKGLDMGDELVVEILGQLVQGKKTLTEITESVYGLTRSDDGYQSSYSKVTREIRRLESKGLVSRRLFGKDKPYRLTQHAVINLARIGGEGEQLSLVTKNDLVLYVGTLAMGVPVAVQALNLAQIGEIVTVMLFPCFCFLLGLSCCRVLQTIRSVF
jgi:hypothetical protein